MSAGPTGTPLTRKAARKSPSSASGRCPCAAWCPPGRASLPQPLQVLVVLDQRLFSRESLSPLCSRVYASTRRALRIHSQVSNSAVEGFLSIPGSWRISQKRSLAAARVARSRLGKPCPTWPRHRRHACARHALDRGLDQGLGQLDAMKDAAAQKGVRQPAFLVAGDDHDRRPFRPRPDHMARMNGCGKLCWSSSCKRSLGKSRGALSISSINTTASPSVSYASHRARLCRKPYRTAWVSAAMASGDCCGARGRALLHRWLAASRLGPVQVADGVELVEQILRG